MTPPIADPDRAHELKPARTCESQRSDPDTAGHTGGTTGGTTTFVADGVVVRAPPAATARGCRHSRIRLGIDHRGATRRGRGCSRTRPHRPHDDAVGLLTHAARPDGIEVVTIRAKPEGHGVGRALLEELVHQARSQRGARIWLVTTDDNTSVRSTCTSGSEC
jgi:Acetyltransferase (GNAT) family